MRRVEFVDTSILVEFLNVPGRSQHRKQVLAEFKRKRASGTHFVLPTAAVIETGNHVHHIAEGSKRLGCAQAFAQLLSPDGGRQGSLGLVRGSMGRFFPDPATARRGHCHGHRRTCREAVPLVRRSQRARRAQPVPADCVEGAPR